MVRLRLCTPSDSATTTAKNRTAPLTSLNQLQLKLKKMEDLVTAAIWSLTRVLMGGTGGPAGVVTAGGVGGQFTPPPQPQLQRVHTLQMPTVNHGDHAVLDLLAGGPTRDHLHRHRVALVWLQLGDDISGGIPASAPGVHQSLGVSVQALNGVGVVVSLRGRPGAGDGGRALRPTVETLDSLGLCRGKRNHQSPLSWSLPWFSNSRCCHLLVRMLFWTAAL